MSIHTQIIYQIVFSTKNRETTLEPKSKELYRYISGILKNKQCHLYQIGGTGNHIHIITHLHPAVSLAGLVKDIKLASSIHIKTNDIFQNFKGWQSGYGAFTYHSNEKEKLINYVENQENHHRTKSFTEEYIDLLNEHRIIFENNIYFKNDSFIL